MINFTLNEAGTYALKTVDGVSTGSWSNVETNQEYLDWLAKGNIVSPYVAPPDPEPLTAQQKLENAGLTVDELKTLLGI